MKSTLTPTVAKQLFPKPLPIRKPHHGPSLAAAIAKLIYGTLPSNSQGDRHGLALVKGEERYLIACDDASIPEALRTLGRWACDPTLSFTWHDAAVLSQKLRGRK